MVERGGEQKPKLHEVVVESTNTLLETNVRLSIGVVAALSSEGGGDRDEVFAALDLMERIANVSRNLLETRGDAIFGKNGVHQNDSNGESIKIEASGQPEEESGPSREPEVVGPKTFGELLESKIDELLPHNKKSYKKKELYDLLNNKNGTKKAILDAGYVNQKKTFTRDETASVVRAIAIGGRSMTKPKERYDRAQIAASIFSTSRKLLNDYSQLVGHDWKTDPEVDLKTFGEIRGILQIDKLINKQKTALQEPSTSLD